MPDVTYDIPRDDEDALKEFLNKLKRDFPDDPKKWYRAIAIYMSTNIVLYAMRARGVVDYRETVELADAIISMTSEVGYLVGTEYDDGAFNASIQATLDEMIRRNPNDFVRVDEGDNDPSKYRN